MLNCTIHGKLHPIDDTKFSKPMPFVGLYISAATLLCVAAMLADLIHGIRIKQYWIPNRYFSLNAASITILGVAIKLSVDFNTPMPGQLDQLAKLSTSAFLCTVLANFIPSVAKLEKNELLGNIIGLSIVVITSVVNLCIQLRTNVIYLFKPTHVGLMCIMVFSLAMMVFEKLYPSGCSATMQILYERQHKRALRESFEDRDKEKVATKKLEEYLINCTSMAHSSCPHFAWTRSGFCWLPVWMFSFSSTACVLFTGLIQISPDKHLGLTSCSGESGYGQSVIGIVITQSIAVAIGLIIPSIRMVYILMAVRKASRSEDKESPERQYFWMPYQGDAIFHPYYPYVKYKHPMCTLPMIQSYPILLWAVYYLLLGIITIPLVPLLEFIFSVSKTSGCNNHNASTLHPNQNSGLGPYVLYSEDEEDLIEMLMESASNVTKKYIDSGRKQEPKHLIQLLDNYLSQDFGGVVSFDSDEVPPLHPQGSPPNCWTLPVVTLASIAIALPNVNHKSIDKLIRSVNEGLVYVNIIEYSFGDKHELINIKTAAKIEWAGVDLFHNWLDKDTDLRELALQNRSPMEVIKSLSHSAEDRFSKAKCSSMDMLEAIAAHSMYRICQTLLWEYKNENNVLDRSSERIFEKICITISDIFGACFANLKRWILLECSRSSPERRRETAYRILRVFGETEKIMKIVEQRETPNLSPEQMGFIDEWRAFCCPM